MKILVTGGYGLIGHNVISRLQKLKHHTYIVDTKTNYGIIPQSELDYLMKERAEKIGHHLYWNADISDAVKMQEVFEQAKPDVVIHMASFPRQKVVNANPALGARTMMEGLLNLCELAITHNVKHFVYISSSMVYGDFEDYVTEASVCKPQGQYGIMKLAGEDLVKDYSRRGCFTHTIIRPSAVYGPLDVEDRVISKFLLTAMRGGVLKVNGIKETLDFTYVDDAADGIVAAALNESARNKTYNITKSHSKTLLEAAELAVKLVGKGTIEVKDKDADFPSRGALDITLARRDLNFDPKIDIDEGFEIYFNWLKSSNYWQQRV